MGRPGAGNSEIVRFWCDCAHGVLCGDGLCAGHDIDFANLDEMSSTGDIHFRVEILPLAQFHFAMSLGEIDLRTGMLSATHRMAVATNDACLRAALRFDHERNAA